MSMKSIDTLLYKFSVDYLIACAYELLLPLRNTRTLVLTSSVDGILVGMV
jgi:hypothetical protein